MTKMPINGTDEPIEDLSTFLETLRSADLRLWAGSVGTHEHLPAEPVGPGVQALFVAKISDGNELAADKESGLGVFPPGLFVSSALLKLLRSEIEKDDSEVRKHSIWPVRRTFVYVDISDFSKRPTGVQQFTIAALAALAAEQEWPHGKPRIARSDMEAELCIGDGYIYVFRKAVHAVYFAGRLAKMIEERSAKKVIPELHFRMGVHVGDVRYFWDPGRKAWNYVGAGINGGQRVLATIVNADDVVFVSAEVREEILADANEPSTSNRFIHNLANRGRRPDKHDKMWRVYELNHHAAISEKY